PPAAAGLAGALRVARAKRRSRRGRGRTFVMLAAVPQVAPALAAALVAGWSAWAIPFFPRGWPLGLAALAGGAALWRPRLGLAVALAVPVLPLGSRVPAAACRSLTVAAVLLALAV